MLSSSLHCEILDQDEMALRVLPPAVLVVDGFLEELTMISSSSCILSSTPESGRRRILDLDVKSISTSCF